MKIGLWFWRRLLSWVLIIAAHATIGWIVWASPGAGYLGNVALALVAEALIVYSVYFGGSTLQGLIELASKIAPGIKIGWGGVTTPPANAATVNPAPRVPDE